MPAGALPRPVRGYGKPMQSPWAEITLPAIGAGTLHGENRN